MQRTVACLLWLLFARFGACQQWVAEESGEVYSRGYDADVVEAQFVEYTDNGTPLEGFLAYDNSTADERPAVLIVPDWDGVGEYEQWRAKLLASLGYVGFVADIYGADVEQGPSLPMPERGALVGQYTGNPDLYRSRMAAAMDQVREHELVDADNIAVIGYCFGGTGALEIMRMWPAPATDGLKGVVGFHTSGLVIGSSPAQPGNPIVVSMQQGEDDQSIDPVDAMALKDELSSANMTWEYTSYGGVVHAFTEPSLVPGFGNARYDHFADMRSWDSLKSLLAMLFGEATSSY